MRALLIILLTAIAATGCSKHHVIRLGNDADIDRKQEMVEVARTDIEAIMGDEPFVLLNSSGEEVPYQVTYDDKVIFAVDIKAHGSTGIEIVAGEPSAVDTVVCGAFYPERKDDLAWENDRMAYRAYGPALQAAGEHAYGYDIWTKSIAEPVVARRYHEAFTMDKNFHEDHGDGMDVYTVGPTLGGGTAALIDSVGHIVYPWCFSTYEILDNGPLRFSVKLSYPTGETRLISLDKGEFLNHTRVSFAETPYKRIGAGIVIHSQNPNGYEASPEQGYIAYADLTDDSNAGNGVIYIGVVPVAAASMCVDLYDSPRGDAIGHILAKQAYTAGEWYEYYWGSGWSKGFMPDWQAWKEYLSNFNTRLQHPITITIE